MATDDPKVRSIAKLIIDTCKAELGYVRVDTAPNGDYELDAVEIDGVFDLEKLAEAIVKEMDDVDLVKKIKIETLERMSEDLTWLGAQGNLVYPDTAWAGITDCREMIARKVTAIKNDELKDDD